MKLRKGLRHLGIVSLVMLAITAILLATGCGEKLLSDAEYIQRAKEHQDKGDLIAASIELKNALRVNPDHPEVRWLLGKIYVELGHGAAAEKELQRAVELGVARDGIAIPLGQAYLLQKKHAQLIADIQPLTTLTPDANAHINAMRSDAYLGLGNQKEAEAALQEAMQLSARSKEVRVAYARYAVAKRQIDEARKWLEEVLADAPEYAPAWKLRGDLDRWQLKLKDAEQSYTKAIDNSHNNDNERLMRAMVRIGLKDYEGAEKDLKILVKVAPKHPGVNYAQGLINFQQEKYREAQLAFEKSVALDKNYAPALYYLGSTHFAQRQHEQAEQYLSQYLTMAPRSTAAAKMLGVIYLRNKNLSKAESVLLPVLTRQPDDVVVLNLLANIALAQGNAEKSIAYLNKVAAINPDQALSRARLGFGLLVEGEDDRAINELETSIELQPDLSQADTMLVMSFMKTRKYDQALEAAERYRAKQPDSAEPYNLLGLISIARKNEAEAVRNFTAAVQKAPGHVAASVNLANIALKGKRPDEARSRLQEALKHNPDNTYLAYRLARLEADSGNLQLAVEMLKKAVAKEPTSPEPVMELARLYLESGQPEEALAIVQKIQAQSPNQPDVLAVVGEAEMNLGQIPRAMPALRKLVEIQPNAQNYYLLARAHVAARDYAAAQRAVDQSLKIQADYLPARVGQVHVLTLLKKTAQASARFKQLQTDFPNQQEILVLESWLATYNQQPEAAISALRKAFQLKPTRRVVIELAEAQIRAGDAVAAIATLNNWLKDHQDDMLISLKVAHVYMTLNRDDEARAAYEKVVALAPNFVPALNNLAWLLRTQDLPRALSYAERNYELAPKSPVVVDTLAMLMLEKGSHAEAVRLLQTVNAMVTPASPTYQYHLALALSKSGDKPAAISLLDEIFKKKAQFPEEQQAKDLRQQLNR
ncbi:MAG: hypothetical protein A2V90_00400 [Gammaproteobacteria bacterium RBG_16_57_12]|nr:MAG: hypothetical protein A2V90_00400 [Gammaproteobacteria bacterium RBG_16_57_12]